MVVIELFVYVSIISVMVVCVYFMKKRELFKKLDLLYFSVLSSLIISQIIIIITLIFNSDAPELTDTNPPISLVCIGAILVLALIYIISLIMESSTEIREYARTSTGWAMFIALGVGFLGILIWYPETKMDLYRMPIALALCIGMQYYPPVLNQLSELKNIPEKDMEEQKEAVINVTAEKSMEGHKEVVINLAIESWHLAKVFERALTQLNVDQPKGYASQLRWFVKKTEESLEDVGLRIVNVEGHPYDPGMPATFLNIDKFDADDTLVVDLMLEPIIMEGTVLIKTGKVTLRRINYE